MFHQRYARAVLAVVAFFVVPVSALAQEVGVKAGINFASMTPLEDQDPDTTPRLAPVGGIWIRMPREGLSFQAEGLYSEKGVEWAFGPDVSVKIRVRYFEVPLLARGTFGAASDRARVFVVGGAAPAFKLSARSEVRFQGEERTTDNDDDFYSADVGLVGGVGVEFGRFHVEGRYTHGLRHINTDDNGDEDRVRNRVFSVTAGARLR